MKNSSMHCRSFRTEHTPQSGEVLSYDCTEVSVVLGRDDIVQRVPNQFEFIQCLPSTEFKQLLAVIDISLTSRTLSPDTRDALATLLLIMDTDEFISRLDLEGKYLGGLIFTSLLDKVADDCVLHAGACPALCRLLVWMSVTDVPLSTILDWHLANEHRSQLLLQVLYILSERSPEFVSMYSICLMDHFVHLHSRDALDEYLFFLGRLGESVSVNYLIKLLPILSQFVLPGTCPLLAGFMYLLTVLMGSNPVVAHSVIEQIPESIDILKELPVSLTHRIGGILLNLLDLVGIGSGDLMGSVSVLIRFIQDHLLESENDEERLNVTESLVKALWGSNEVVHVPPGLSEQIRLLSEYILGRVMDRHASVRRAVWNGCDTGWPFGRILDMVDWSKYFRVLAEFDQCFMHWWCGRGDKRERANVLMESPEGFLRYIEEKLKIKKFVQSGLCDGVRLASVICRYYGRSERDFVRSRLAEIMPHIAFLQEVVVLVSEEKDFRKKIRIIGEIRQEFQSIGPHWLDIVCCGISWFDFGHLLLEMVTEGRRGVWLKKFAKIVHHHLDVQTMLLSCSEGQLAGILPFLGCKYRKGRRNLLLKNKSLIDKIRSMRPSSPSHVYTCMWLDFDYAVEHLTNNNCLQTRLAIAKYIRIHSIEYSPNDNCQQSNSPRDMYSVFLLNFLTSPELLPVGSCDVSLLARVASLAYLPDVAPAVIMDLVKRMWEIRQCGGSQRLLAKVKKCLLPDFPSRELLSLFGGIRIDLLPLYMALSTDFTDDDENTTSIAIANRLDTLNKKTVLIEYLASLVSYLGLIGLVKDERRFSQLAVACFALVVGNDVGLLALLCKCIDRLASAAPVGVDSNEKVFTVIRESTERSFPQIRNLLLQSDTHHMHIPQILFKYSDEPDATPSTDHCVLLKRRRRRR